MWQHFDYNFFLSRSRVASDKLARNVKVIAEALARHMFDMSSDANSNPQEVFVDALVSVPRIYSNIFSALQDQVSLLFKG